LKRLLFPAITFLLAFQLNAQWVYQNPKPTGRDLTAIKFINEETGFIGSIGFILKTTDGGLSWDNIPVDISWVNDIFFTDQLTGFVSGPEGKILRTTDSGNSWSLIAQIPDTEIYSIFFTSQLTGFATVQAGSLYKTTDGGFTWVKKVMPSGYNHLSAVFFLTPDLGWVGDGMDNKCWYTRNGGETWTFVSLPGSFSSVNSIFFHNANLGYIAGDQKTFLKTTNGGQTWSNLGQNITPFNTHFTDVFFLDSLNGVLTTGSPGATNNTIYRTTNGGITFTSIETGLRFGLLTELSFPSQSVGYSAGMYGNIIKTTDGGENWVTLTKGVRENIQSSYFLNLDTGWVAGNNGLVLKTTDSGENWIRKTTFVNNTLNSIFFISKNHGWAAGNGVILNTNDGGETWDSAAVTGEFYNIFFITEKKGWACGYPGIFSTSEDGGKSWHIDTLLQNIPIRAIYFFSEKEGIINGSSGNILITSDGGLNWETISTGIPGELVNSFDFIDNDVGYACGGYTYSTGFVIKTTDRGKTWNRLTDSTFYGASRVEFIDENFGITLGNGLRYTTNGGETWGRVSVGGNDISFNTRDIGWIVGNYGVIRKTTTGILSSVQDFYSNNPGQTTTAYYISQNYPNPFNPVTNIDYFLPHNSYVNIELYNIMGERVAVLFSGSKDKGTHTFIINGVNNNLASGVYFYRISAEGSSKDEKFTETKKMILLK
jgi:photosystem II stability/assembly factor-like uncharacterized protein